jgi:MFS family permease
LKLGYFIFACFFIIYQYALRVSTGVLLSHFQNTFSLSAYDLSLLSSAFYFGYLLFMLPTGIMIDRYGLHRIWQISLVLLIASCIAFALSHSFLSILIARFVMGVASSGIIVGAIALSIQIFPKRKGLFIGIVVSMCTIGIFIGQGPWSSLVDVLPHWQDVFWVSAIVGLAFLVYWTFMDHTCLLKNKSSNIKGILNVIKPLFRSRYFLILVFYIFILSAIEITFNVLWGPKFFAGIYHISITHAAYLNSILPVGNFIGALLIGLITDKLKKLRMLLITAGIITTALVTLIIYEKVKIPLPVCAFLLFMLGGLQSINVIVFSKISDHFHTLPKASVQSVVNIFNIAGGPLLQLLTGYIMTTQTSSIYQQIDSNNIAHSLMVIPLLMLVATALIWALPHNPLVKSKRS